MYSSVEKPVSLLEILTDERIRQNVEQMFEVGTLRHQESGFAVYESGHSFKVSELLVPDIDMTSGDLETVRQSSMSFNGIALYRKQKTFDSVSDAELPDYQFTEDYVKAAYAEINYQPSPLAKRKIDAIQASNDLQHDEKEDLIELVMRNDLATKDNIRSDILLAAHNHPQTPTEDGKSTFSRLSGDMVTPSGADLKLQRYLGSSNNNLTGMIVAASERDQTALLYAGLPDSSINAERYMAGFDYRRGTNYNLGRLASVGVIYCVVNLTDNATLTNSQQNKVLDFEESRKA